MSDACDEARNAEKALFGVILEHRNQCLSQASMMTGYGVSFLEEARDSLLEKNLIRPVLSQEDRETPFYSFEVNL